MPASTPERRTPSPTSTTSPPADLHLVLLAAAVLAVPLLFYLLRGATAGFFAADDFQWLTGARDGGWTEIVTLGNRDHFYRPVIRLWFALAVTACGQSTACYHWLQLGLHATAGALLFALTWRLLRHRWLSTLATAIFMISPGYAEAVLWISCATEVLCAIFMLTAILLAVRAADRASPAASLLSALAALASLFSHEAGAALFLLIPAVFALTGRLQHLRVSALWPFALVAIAFVAATLLANARNPILMGGEYRPGVHMVRHALDYLVSLYIGPHDLTGYLTMTALVVLVAVFGSTAARLGLAWMLIAMLPFLGFVAGNTSRYLYTPTMGFGWMVAALLVSAHGQLVRRSLRPHAAAAAVAVLAAFIVIRFASFTKDAIRDRLDWFAAYEAYATAFERSRPDARGAAEITAPFPATADVGPDYIQPMLRWTLRSPNLIVRVEPGLLVPVTPARPAAERR
jgi:hypothetical protein